MRNPDLNYPRLVSLEKRIKRTPTYIKSDEVKEWDLEDLLVWINQERAEHFSTTNALAIANETTIDRWPFNPELERLEGVVKAEIERRGGAEPKKEAPLEPVTFRSLFLSAESMEQALKAAATVEMIRRNGEVIKWAGKWHVGAIVIFWEHLELMNPPMVDKGIDSKLAIDIIAERFGKTVSDRAKTGTPAYRKKFELALKAAF